MIIFENLRKLMTMLIFPKDLKKKLLSFIDLYTRIFNYL